jgi:hypothetical protein
MMTPVTRGVGVPAELVPLAPDSGLSPAFDMAKDGSRLLMVRTTGEDRMTVIVNFRAELARLQAGK